MSKKAIWVVALFIGLSVGGVGGFLIGAATSEFGRKMWRESFASEQHAAIDNPNQISRKHFSAKIASNWDEDKMMADYHAEHYFSFDSLGGNYAMFQIYDMPTDAVDNTREYAKDYTAGLKEITKKSFSKWGKYSGQGIELKGKSMGVTPARIRIFSHSSAKKSFIVVEYRYDQDEEKTRPGFDLIEKTFQLKGA